MKTLHLLVSAILFFLVTFSYSQDKKSKESYYTSRAKEDAKFEQSFKTSSKSDEKKFWKEQKEYEKNLKEKDEIAYNAYIKGKQDAYKEHHEYCNENHCHHSKYYHYHADFYYYGEYNYQRRTYKRSTNTNIKVKIPSVRLGIF